MPAGARIVVLPLCAALLSGCSLLFVTRPPAQHSSEVPLECTTSAALPVIDSLVAGFQVVRTGIALGANESSYANVPISRGADIAFGVGLSTLFALSAGYGYVNTSKCSKMKHAAASAKGSSEPDYSPPAGARFARPLPPRVPSGPACSHDAQCKPTQVCERDACVEYRPPREKP